MTTSPPADEDKQRSRNAIVSLGPCACAWLSPGCAGIGRRCSFADCTAFLGRRLRRRNASGRPPMSRVSKTRSSCSSSNARWALRLLRRLLLRLPPRLGLHPLLQLRRARSRTTASLSSRRRTPRSRSRSDSCKRCSTSSPISPPLPPPRPSRLSPHLCTSRSLIPSQTLRWPFARRNPLQVPVPLPARPIARPQDKSWLLETLPVIPLILVCLVTVQDPVDFADAFAQPGPFGPLEEAPLAPHSAYWVSHGLCFDARLTGQLLTRVVSLTTARLAACGRSGSVLCWL